MMRKAVLASVLLFLCSMVLGSTVFREDVAHAAQAILPVKVVNTPAEAVPVREQATSQPVQAQVFGSFVSGDSLSSEETVYTVPAGKMLVIESFTGASIMDATDHLMDAVFRVEVSGFLDSFNWYLQPVDEGVAHTGARVFRGSEQVTAYAGPGTTVKAMATRRGDALAGTSVLFGLAGHLVNAPTS